MLRVSNTIGAKDYLEDDLHSIYLQNKSLKFEKLFTLELMISKIEVQFNEGGELGYLKRTYHIENEADEYVFEKGNKKPNRESVIVSFEEGEYLYYLEASIKRAMVKVYYQEQEEDIIWQIKLISNKKVYSIEATGLTTTESTIATDQGFSATRRIAALGGDFQCDLPFIRGIYFYYYS